MKNGTDFSCLSTMQPYHNRNNVWNFASRRFYWRKDEHTSTVLQLEAMELCFKKMLLKDRRRQASTLYKTLDKTISNILHLLFLPGCCQVEYKQNLTPTSEVANIFSHVLHVNYPHLMLFFLFFLSHPPKWAEALCICHCNASVHCISSHSPWMSALSTLKKTPLIYRFQGLWTLTFSACDGTGSTHLD